MKKSRKKRQHDAFLVYLYTHSSLSPTTQQIYMRWVTQCCEFHDVQHLLDLTPEDLDIFRVHLIRVRQFSLASDTIVYSAFRHTFAVLLSQVMPEEAKRYMFLFESSPRQPYSLPRYASIHLIETFLSALPKTPVGYILKKMYETSQPFEAVKDGWKCSRQYAAVVCAKVARQVGIPHGFGLTGLRGTSIIHRIQQRKNDAELPQILRESGLSDSQFARYMKVAELEKY